MLHHGGCLRYTPLQLLSRVFLSLTYCWNRKTTKVGLPPDKLGDFCPVTDTESDERML